MALILPQFPKCSEGKKSHIYLTMFWMSMNLLILQVNNSCFEIQILKKSASTPHKRRANPLIPYLFYFSSKQTACFLHTAFKFQNCCGRRDLAIPKLFYIFVTLRTVCLLLNGKLCLLQLMKYFIRIWLWLQTEFIIPLVVLINRRGAFHQKF